MFTVIWIKLCSYCKLICLCTCSCWIKNLSPHYWSFCALFICACYSSGREKKKCLHFPVMISVPSRSKFPFFPQSTVNSHSSLAPFWYRKSTFHNPIISQWIKSDIIESHWIFSFRIFSKICHIMEETKWIVNGECNLMLTHTTFQLDRIWS